MRPRAPRWLEPSPWRTWCPSWRSPGGSSCWSRRDRLWTTLWTNWLVVHSETVLQSLVENGILPSFINWHCAAFVLLQVPLLQAGDIIIDGGNSEYRDTTVSHGGNFFSFRKSLFLFVEILTVFVFLTYSGGARVWKRRACCLSAVEWVVEKKGLVMDPH